MDKTHKQELKNLGVRFPKLGERWQNDKTKEVIFIKRLEKDKIFFSSDSSETPLYTCYHVEDDFIFYFSPLDEEKDSKSLEDLEKIAEKINEM
jgi:hypothetical protein